MEGGILMWLFGKKKAEKAREALRTQFGIDTSDNDVGGQYMFSISEGYDFVAVINRKEHGRFLAKEWYLYDSVDGWVKKASLNRKQSLQLYADTKPYYVQDTLEEQGGRLTPEDEEEFCLIICDEYISTHMTERYLGFKIRVLDDIFWNRGSWKTEAKYMPHRLNRL